MDGLSACHYRRVNQGQRDHGLTRGSLIAWCLMLRFYPHGPVDYICSTKIRFEFSDWPFPVCPHLLHRRELKAGGTKKTDTPASYALYVTNMLRRKNAQPENRARQLLEIPCRLRMPEGFSGWAVPAWLAS